MAKLYYFDARGLGEIIRLTLAAADIEFTEEFVQDREQFLQWIEDGMMLFKQLPVLKIDGKLLVQSNAIVRYIGHKAGLCGKDEDERVLVDMYYEGGRDFFKYLLSVIFARPEEEVLKNCKENVLPKYLPIFNKLLSDQGTGYLVGSSLTLADLSLLEPLLAYVEYFGKEILSDYPAVESFYTSMIVRPNIAAFLSGPQRKKKNTDALVKNVKTILNW